MNVDIIEGEPNSSVIFHVPHSSRVIPDEVRAQLLLTDEELEIELDEMTDSKTDQLAFEARMRSRVKPWIFRNTLSRLVIDPERFPDDREAMNAIGMGVVYQRTSSGEKLRDSSPARDQGLIEKYFEPYSKALEELVRKVLINRGAVTLVDVHSYRLLEHPNSLNKGQQRPPVCLGVDAFHTPNWLIDVAIGAFQPLGEVVKNEPYAGTYVPLSMYETEKGVTSIMMENREDVLQGEGLSRAADALAQLVGGIESRR